VEYIYIYIILDKNQLNLIRLIHAMHSNGPLHQVEMWTWAGKLLPSMAQDNYTRHINVRYLTLYDLISTDLPAEQQR
jgi:hypothetical protein